MAWTRGRILGNPMNTSIISFAHRLPILAIVISMFVAACGGSSGTDKSVTPGQTTGTVALLFTDKPTDEFSAIKLNVIEAILIGGDGQQSLFLGSKAIDLLDLTNYNEPVVFGQVAVGTYTKLRLVIDNLELVPKDGGDSIFPALPANGKIDLLEPNGFAVLPGRTLMAEIDMDANKSIKITGTGNGRRYNFRPVVKANFMDGGLPDKLARIEGIVGEIFVDPAGSFSLCDVDMLDNCVTVVTGAATSIFNNEGLATDITSLSANGPAVVIGRYIIEPDIVLDSLVLEIGGNAEQLSGNVVSTPVESKFLMLTSDDGDIVVELQAGTKFFNAAGEIGPDSIVIGADLEVEGVLPAKADAADPDLIRAALVFVEAEDDEQLTGTIGVPLDAATRSFVLLPEVGNPVNVRVSDVADILLVDEAASTVTMGTIDDLALEQMVDLFGITAADGFFDANEVIVEVVSTP
jgi:hypothetical protein